MTRIGGSFEGVSSQTDPERRSERQRKPLERVEGGSAAEPTFDPADRRLAQPDHRAESRLRSVPTKTSIADVESEPNELLVIGPFGVKRESRPEACRHSRCMVAACASLAITRHGTWPDRPARLPSAAGHP
ncbi:MAG TPA: hypothetical protein VH440_14180 [Candidatus Limnocylindrales bacterium]